MTRKKDVAAHAQPRVRFSGSSVSATWAPPPAASASAPLDASLRDAPELGTQLRALATARGSLRTCSLDDAVDIAAFALSVAIAPGAGTLSRAAFSVVGAAPSPNCAGVARAISAACACSPSVGVALWVAALDDAALRRALVAFDSTWAVAPFAAAASGAASAADALSSDAATSPAHALIIADEAIAALKLAATCLSGVDSSAAAVLAEAPAARDTLVHHAVVLLGRGPALVKDVLTAAALALTRVGVASQSRGDAQLVGSLEWAFSTACSTAHGGGMPLISRLALLRGLLVNLSVHQLARREVDLEKSGGGDGGGAGIPAETCPCILAGCLWRPLAAAVSVATSDSLSRQFALQTLQAWLAALRRVSQNREISGVADSSVSIASALTECTLLFPTLLEFVATAWDTRGPHASRVTALAADIFSATLDCAAELSSSAAGSACAGLVSRVLSFALALPEGSAAWAAALLKIVRGNGGGVEGGATGVALLTARPDIVEAMIRVAAGDPRAGVREAGSAPATLLVAFLSSVRGDWETAAGLPRSVSATGGGAGLWVRATRTLGAAAAVSKLSKSAQAKLDLDDSATATARRAARANILRLITDAGRAAAASELASGKGPSRAVDVGAAAAKEAFVRATASVTGAAAAPGATTCEFPPFDATELDSLLAAALSDVIYSVWVTLWVPLAAPLLLSPSRTVRSRAACYVARDLLELDAETPSTLLHAVDAAVPLATVASDDECAPVERRQWALVMIARTVRNWTDLSTTLEWSLVARAADPETRVTLLELVALGSAGGIERTVDRLPLNDVERVLSRAFLFSASLPLFELRKRATRAFSVLLARAAASSAADGSDAPKDAAAVAADAAWIRDVIGTCASCVYPGAPSERVALPLEISSLALRSGGGADSVSQTAACVLGTHAFAGVLLTMLCEPAERTRAAAAAVLTALGSRRAGPTSVCGIAGFSTAREVSALVDWAALLTASPRDREAAGGAAAFRVIHAVYARAGGWHANSFFPNRRDGVPALAPPPAEMGAAAADSASRSFALALCSLLRARTRALKAAVDEYIGTGPSLTHSDEGSESLSSTPPLVHGVATALRTTILDAAPPSTRAWRFVVSRALDGLADLQRTALVVVTNSNVNDGDGDGNGDGPSLAETLDVADDDADVGAGVSAAPTAADDSLELKFAGRVDARKRLVGPVSNSVNGLVGVGAKRGADLAHAVVVAAWLSTREAVRAQADIIAALKLPSKVVDSAAAQGDDDGLESDEDAGAAIVDAAESAECYAAILADDALNTPAEWLVSSGRVISTLRLLVSSLMELRHVGSIAATADALRTVASRLLLRGDVARQLSREPAHALRGLLRRLSSGGAFILRRSAGFGYAIAAILHAEPNNVPARLLPATLQSLLVLAAPTDESDGWRASVHARHILSLLFRDAALGSDVSPWCGAALRAALSGFASRAWAVRNASHMLFGAVIDRGLGMSKNAPDSRATDGQGAGIEQRNHGRVSLALLESCLPGARAAVLSVLERAADAPAAETFPAVLLLMRCAADDADEVAEESPRSAGSDVPPRSVLVEALLPLLAAKHGFVRASAAAAVGGLIARNRVSVLCGLAAAAMAASETNAAHGALVAVRAALRESARRYPPGVASVDGVAAMRAALAPLIDTLPDVVANPKAHEFVRAEALSILADVDKFFAASVAVSLLGDDGRRADVVALAPSLETAVGTTIGSAVAGGWVASDETAKIAARVFLLGNGTAEAAATAFSAAFLSSQNRESISTALCPHVLIPLVSDSLARLTRPPLCAALVGAAAALATAAPRGCDAVVALAASPRALAALLMTATCADASAAESAWRVLGSGVARALVEYVTTSGLGAGVSSSGGVAVGAGGDATDHVTYDVLSGSLLLKFAGLDGVNADSAARALRAIARAAAHAAGGAVYSLRIAVARALGDSCLAALPLSRSSAPLSAARKSADASSLEFVWPALLDLAVDADDEVREAARAAFACALALPSNALSTRAALETALSADGAVVRNAPPATRNLLRCGGRVSGDTLISAVSDAAASELIRGLSSDAIFLAAHEALLFGARAGGSDRISRALKLAGSRAAAPLAPARAAILTAIDELTTTAAVFAPHDAIAPAPVGLFCTDMLTRPAFLPAADGGSANEFSEVLITGGLAAGLWRSLTDGPDADACMHPAALASLLGGATALVAAANDGTIGDVLDCPVLVRCGAWVPSGAADSLPVAFAAARIAEAILID